MLTQEDVAQLTGKARSSIARYETGEMTPGTAACRALSKVYVVSFDELWDAIENNGPQLMQLVPGWFSFYTSVEQTATAVRIWEPTIVPGLLQTEDYARALLGDDDLVSARLARQAMALRAENPVELTALVDESLLYRPIGGQHTLADQLQHLVDMAARPNVEVQLFPFDAPSQPLWFGALAILSFPWTLDGLAYLEHAADAVYVHRPDDVARHVEYWNRAVKLALSPAESINRIHRRTGELQL